MLRQLKTIIFLIMFSLFNGTSTERFQNKWRKFPRDFLFGAASSAYQIEGAWSEDGKSANVWDNLTHTRPCIIKNCQTGDIACDSYHKYKEDVNMMRELKLNFYRFSISWSRVLPTSFSDIINRPAVQYYNNLINEMLKYNITPMITMIHHDWPQKVEDLGGWNTPQIIDWFVNYARILFVLFGDRVKTWFTVNEPKEVCQLAYAGVAPGFTEYICAKHVLLAHAKVYHLYNTEFRSKQSGKLSIVLNSFWYEPETEKDIQAAEDMIEFEIGQFAHPIFSETGDWPNVMVERIAAKSIAQGFNKSRLPEFTKEEVKMIRGTADFFALNHYTTSIIYRNASVEGYYPSPSLLDDIGVISYQPIEWEDTEAPWLKVVPWGFYKILNKIREEYGNPSVYVTENGCPVKSGFVDDQRISYHRRYLNAMLDSIEEGSNIKTYTVWSLMDNFEWFVGYQQKFGLHSVDFESANRTRIPRMSAYFIKNIIETHMLLKTDIE